MIWLYLGGGLAAMFAYYAYLLVSSRPDPYTEGESATHEPAPPVLGEARIRGLRRGSAPGQVVSR